MKTLWTTLAILTSTILQPTCATAQQTGFIDIGGPAQLGARVSAARDRAGRGSGPYWVAYGFPVRADVAVDINIDGFEATTAVGGAGEFETRNLGVFMLYEGSGAAPSRVEVYNLDRRREHEGRPVYWLGKAGASESLDLLREVIGRTSSDEAARKLTTAVGLHDDAQVAPLLEGLARTAPSEGARGEAARWLGRLGNHLPTLSGIARNGDEQFGVRAEAIRAIGKSRQPGSGLLLAELYDSLETPALKSVVLDGAGNNRQPEAIALLNRLAQGEPDAGLRLQAQQKLRKATGAKKAKR